MKAVQAVAPGGVDRLVYGDHPDPRIGVDDVVVAVKAASVNHADIWLRRGNLGPLPMIPGMDAAGTIAAAGAAVTGLEVGDRVLVDPAIVCQACRHCLSGDHGTCPDKRSLGQRTDGTYAELVKVPARNVHLLADQVTFEEAAAAGTAFFTAWHVLVTRALLRPGERLLVTAALGGVGSAALQVGKLAGAEVIAAAGSDAKLARATELGADAVVNYTAEDLGERIFDLSDGRGVDVVLDLVGAPLWDAYLACVRPGGRIVASGYTGGRQLSLDVQRLIHGGITVLGSGPCGAKAEVAIVVELLNRGQIRGVVGGVYGLADAPEAHRVMERRDVMGKLVLVP